MIKVIGPNDVVKRLAFLIARFLVYRNIISRDLIEPVSIHGKQFRYPEPLDIHAKLTGDKWSHLLYDPSLTLGIRKGIY